MNGHAILMLLDKQGFGTPDVIERNDTTPSPSGKVHPCGIESEGGNLPWTVRGVSLVMVGVSVSLRRGLDVKGTKGIEIGAFDTIVPETDYPIISPQCREGVCG